MEENVSNIEQAGHKAGFKPLLPSAEVLPARPQLRVMGPISVKQRINVNDLNAALGKAGARDVNVPTPVIDVVLPLLRALDTSLREAREA